MASSKEIQRILARLQTSILERPETLSSSSSSNDFVRCIEHHSLLSSDSVSAQSSIQEWLKTINSFLRSSSDRLLGLSLLRETLRQCSTNVFKAHYVSWFRQLCSIAFVEISPSREARGAALRCLVQVIAVSSSLPECAREMTSRDNVPQVVASLVQLEKESTLDGGLACLIECARSYPGATGSIGKGKLEKKSLTILQDPRLRDDDSLIGEAALFFALLPKLGGAGVRGSRYREAWESQFSLLLETLNGVVDDLFQGAVHFTDARDVLNNNDSSVKSPPPLLPLEPIRDEDNLRSFLLLHRFRVLTECLAKMLSTDLGVSVRIPFTRVLSLVFRLCNVTPSSLTFKPTNESLTLAAILPELYSASLKVLRSSLSTAGNRLFKHGSSVNRLILQLLNSTTLKDDRERRLSGSDACFQKCRGSIYEFLTSWIFVYPSMKTGTKGESASKWIAHMLDDARPPEAEKATLKSDGASDGSDGKRRVGGGKVRKKTKGSLFESSSVTSDRKVDNLANVDVCASALKAARAMVLTQGRALPREIHKGLVEFCVPLLQSVCLRGRTNLPASIPYSSADCRLALFRLLESLALNPTPKWPPPLAAAAAIFRQGARDPVESVRHFCLEANVVVANLIHPRVHPFQMPIVVPKDESVSRKRRKDSGEEENEADVAKEKEKRRHLFQEPNLVDEAEDESGCDDEGSVSKATLVENGGTATEEEEEEEEAAAAAAADDLETEAIDRVRRSSASVMEEPQPGAGESLFPSDAFDSNIRTAPSEVYERSLETDDVGRDEVKSAQQLHGDQKEAKKDVGDDDEDAELAAMLRDFNPDADPDPI